jgi:GTP-binding protein
MRPALVEKVMTFEKKDVRFLKSASRLSEGPQGFVPEVALAGRSNSGKSSLINALSKNSKMAKVSSTPGKTILLNFFEVEGLFRLVDMPGYGYAQRSKADRTTWASMVEGYLAARGQLCGVVLVMDGRRVWAKEEEQLRSNGGRGHKNG